jgi:putative FmdB family regulatory protein
MPLYEYECGSCGLRFERIRKFSDPPVTTCPDCGGTVSKLISSPAIQFKGSGWYITDYAKSGQKEPGGGAKEGSPKDGAAKETGKAGESGESKTDSSKSSSENTSSEKSTSQKSGSEKSSSGGASSPAKPAGPAKPAAS